MGVHPNSLSVQHCLRKSWYGVFWTKFLMKVASSEIKSKLSSAEVPYALQCHFLPSLAARWSGKDAKVVSSRRGSSWSSLVLTSDVSNGSLCSCSWATLVSLSSLSDGSIVFVIFVRAGYSLSSYGIFLEFFLTLSHEIFNYLFLFVIFGHVDGNMKFFTKLSNKC